MSETLAERWIATRSNANEDVSKAVYGLLLPVIEKHLANNRARGQYCPEPTFTVWPGMIGRQLTLKVTGSGWLQSLELESVLTNLRRQDLQLGNLLQGWEVIFVYGGLHRVELINASRVVVGDNIMQHQGADEY